MGDGNRFFLWIWPLSPKQQKRQQQDCLLVSFFLGEKEDQQEQKKVILPNAGENPAEKTREKRRVLMLFGRKRPLGSAECSDPILPCRWEGRAEARLPFGRVPSLCRDSTRPASAASRFPPRGSTAARYRHARGARESGSVSRPIETRFRCNGSGAGKRYGADQGFSSTSLCSLLSPFMRSKSVPRLLISTSLSMV